jgi:tRNA 5-methylaminomethyl-2-thiouridine biosynthesis bifunctional protein
VTQALLDVWPQATPGFHRLDLPDFNATLDLAIGDVGWALSQWTGQAEHFGLAAPNVQFSSRFSA